MDSGTLALTTAFAPGPLLDPAPRQEQAAPKVSAAQLKSRADEAYALHPGSCSHSVWHVIKLYRPNSPG